MSGYTDPYLFRPLRIRDLTLRNRIVISPMCQHAAEQGHATPWHWVHWGKFALGGAGLILSESTAVDPRGRIGSADLGLWNDAQAQTLQPLVQWLQEQGCAFGLQLAHAGRKAGSQPLWEGGRAIDPVHMAQDIDVWQRVGPSALPAGPGWSVPMALDEQGIQAVIEAFVAATVRADRIGVDVIELHFGHGYLVASFLSPYANQRQDQWGGSREGRMRLAVEIARRVRQVWPASKPLFARLSVVDGSIGGWSEEDSIVLAQALKACGVDVMDCSSGGLTEETRALPVPRGLGFQVPFSEQLRHSAEVMTQAVGMIVDAKQAEAILAQGQADLIAIGREALYDPYWPHHAAQTLGVDVNFEQWPVRHGVWLRNRAPILQRARIEQTEA
ncbi:NADH:flavin oxidoreductase/NADH oxidase [Paenalcaligenes sp. Me52]|uniref:NADH:flavin oxidoreductase/NADH oxidase n=1 Tax=Paenalcaligenes sp. Me52 TaxID=3392038 RepID=UPI003D280C40